MNSIVSFSRYSHVIMSLMKYLQVQLLSQSTSAFKFTKYWQIAVSKVIAKLFALVSIFSWKFPLFQILINTWHYQNVKIFMDVQQYLIFPICISRIISEVVHLTTLGHWGIPLCEFYTYLLLVFLVDHLSYFIDLSFTLYSWILILCAVCFAKISQSVAYLLTLFYGALCYRMHLSPNAPVTNYHNLSGLKNLLSYKVRRSEMVFTQQKSTCR